MPDAEPSAASAERAAAGRGPIEAHHLQKQRVGLDRMVHATRYSLNGLRLAWQEAAFRLEALAALVLLPAAFWLGRSWTETVLLVATMLLVLIVELLNTGIETAIDRVGLEWNPLSRRAKDIGSAAVFLSLLLCGGTWGSAVVLRLAG